MILLIDNYDSFTYNLFQQLSGLGQVVKVIKNDELSLEEISELCPERIVISAGPGRPKDSGISRGVIKEFYQRLPILGVCLGHQCIGEVFGSKIVEAPRIMHGKTDQIFHNGAGLFENIKSPFEAARYHSLAIDELPASFELNAWSEDGTIMGMSHKKYPLFGVQFHPESFMTDHGQLIMENFLNA